MNKVVTERPRVGHSRPSLKTGRRLTKDEFEAEDHGPTRYPVSRNRQYYRNPKEFTDVLGPLHGFLRKNVGRPWDKVYSEIKQTLNTRTLSGQHILTHVSFDVERDCFEGPDGKIYRSRWVWGTGLIDGFFVHPRTKLLCFQKAEKKRWTKNSEIEAIRPFGLTKGSSSWIVVDNLTVLERRESGDWFVHFFKDLDPNELVDSGRYVWSDDQLRLVREKKVPRHKVTNIFKVRTSCRQIGRKDKKLWSISHKS